MFTWGEMEVSKKGNATHEAALENYLYIVTDMVVRFPDPNKQIFSPYEPEFSDTVDGKPKTFEKHYKLIFFSDETELFKEIEKFSAELKT
jgi:hypothetical protein